MLVEHVLRGLPKQRLFAVVAQATLLPAILLPHMLALKLCQFLVDYW